MLAELDVWPQQARRNSYDNQQNIKSLVLTKHLESVPDGVGSKDEEGRSPS